MKMAKQLRCIVVDDEEMSLKLMESLIRKVATLKLLGSFTNALEARTFLSDTAIDVLFVDIEMPALSGLDFIRTLTDKPEIVITSANEKYALDAFEIEVADYLLKPITLERFVKSVARIESRIKDDAESTISQDTIFIKANNQVLSIRLSDIVYIEAFGDYVNIFTIKDTRYVVHSTMKGIESKLPLNQFVRVHRSHIVRIDKIDSIEDTVLVLGKKLITIGDSYRADLMNRLNFL